MSLLVPQHEVSQQAHVISWEILWNQGRQCRHREVCCACEMITGCSLQQMQWGLGQAGNSTPSTPLVPSSARHLAPDRVAVALWSPPFQNNCPKNGKWQRETSLGEPASMVPLSQLPTAIQRTAGRDGSPPPPSPRYAALAALCSLVARAPALVSVRASLCRVTFQWPSHPLATGCPGCPYG